MKVAIFALTIVAILVMVHAEVCQDVSDCSQVTCQNNAVKCLNHQCTCQTALCQADEECPGLTEMGCYRGWHCIKEEGICKCGIAFSGIGK